VRRSKKKKEKRGRKWQPSRLDVKSAGDIFPGPKFIGSVGLGGNQLSFLQDEV
jgi:hypothetical protein